GDCINRKSSLLSSFPRWGGTLTARQTFDRCCKIWLLVGTIAIAATDDSWAIALGGPNTIGSCFVAVDDDDSDDHPEYPPLAVCGNIDTTIRQSFVRGLSKCLDSVDLNDDPGRSCAPRGPPDDRPTDLGRPKSSSFKSCVVDAAIVLVLPTSSTPQQTSSAIQIPADSSCSPRSSVARSQRRVLSRIESTGPAVGVPAGCSP